MHRCGTGNGHVGGNGWCSSSNTDLTLSSREPSGSYSAGSLSFVGMQPMLEPEGTPQVHVCPAVVFACPHTLSCKVHFEFWWFCEDLRPMLTF